MDTLAFAREFGSRAHGKQLYADRYPFLMHLDRVYWTLVEFGVDDPNILRAAYLHDTLEDTDVTPSTIRLFFGDKVCRLVEGVTMPWDDDRERSLRFVIGKMQVNSDIEVLKVADRLSNVRLAVVEGTDKILRFYGKEHEIFKRGRGDEVGHPAVYRMWLELNEHLNGWAKND